MQNYDLLIDRIVKASGLEKEEIERKVEAKKAKLSGLISKEGAAQIIAAELGISFEDQDLKIQELMPGMKRVNVVGKIIRLFPIREYEKNGKSGKVANFILADETGNMRVVLWDTNHIDLIERGEIKEGDSVEIKNASVRDSELHLSGFSEFKSSTVVLGDVKTEQNVLEKTLEEATAGDSIRIRGTIVQIFPVRFYQVCPECGKKVVPDGENFSCSEHGQVLPKEKAILNFVIDDGTESMRVVMFSDQINLITSEEDLKNPEKWSVFRDDFLGSEVFLTGSVRRNKLFGNLEIIANDIKKIDVEELIKELEAKN